MPNFKNLETLIQLVNNELGPFCREFQYTRKELLGLGRAATINRLFEHVDTARDWTINRGGGTEVQYHLHLGKGFIRYGLGFNAQYVPFKNDKTPTEYIKPYIQSFLAQPTLEKQLLASGFDYADGDRSLLANIQYDDYILIGRNLKIKANSDAFELDDVDFQKLNADIKGILFTTYKKIVMGIENSAKQQQKLEAVQKALLHKKQIILQGPPGTGKTHIAKQIADRLCNTTLSESDKPLMHQTLAKARKVFTKEHYEFQLKEVKNDVCQLVIGKNETYSVSLDMLIKLFNNPSEKIEGKSYAVGLVQFLRDHLPNEQKELIQFHPSYTYEDFVRGIMAQNVNGKISYETVDKVLVNLAQRAIKNQRIAEGITLEDRILEGLQEFKEHVIAQMEIGNKIALTEIAFIARTDPSGISYKGESWQQYERIPDHDLILLFLAKPKSRQETKQVSGISKSSVHNATYSFALYNLFTEFLSTTQRTPEVSKETVSEKNYVLIIDEINRANLPSVLGELIYALEYRGEAVKSMYEKDGDADLILPKNLYIIGTMNTADRSVGHIDYAIRRRFAFVDMLPDPDVIKLDKGKDLFHLVVKLFEKDTLAPDFKKEDVQIGHSYFMAKDEQELKLKLDYEILPILHEYVKDGILMDGDETTAVLKQIKEFLG